ncbi:hypothetical protein WG922_21380 [Ramlibacter sp. AN1015]|uniref:hypothetical protein n=1 Tax=Ramlibacter sp. AN1015 TaxID=3133428 RepID=UPI0030BC6EE7
MTQHENKMGHAGAGASGEAYEGPKRFTPEEVAQGNKGIRWVTDKYVAGRPTQHDLLDYIEQRGDEIACACPRCVRASEAIAPSRESAAGAQKQDEHVPAEFEDWSRAMDARVKAPAALTLSDEDERNAFEVWWRASKYCQVIRPHPGWDQIALDGWKARAILSRAGGESRRPLTADALGQMVIQSGGASPLHCTLQLEDAAIMRFARAIERAHGIGGESSNG